MRRVASLLPSWENSSKPESKMIFDKSWAWSETKNSSPMGRSYSKVLAAELQMLNEPVYASDDPLSQGLDIENSLPSTLDKESEKAARILRSFCKNGFHVDPDQFPDSPTDSPRPLMTIPPNVLQYAVGLAIFSVSRAGLWVSSSGGSGVLLARKDDGQWSSPAGILLQTPRLSFAGGVDIYDCVAVINDRQTLSAFTNFRTILGGEMCVSIGPLGELGIFDYKVPSQNVNQPIFTYLKSRGFHANLSMDGTSIIGRIEENKRFYGRRVSTTEILAGKARHSSCEVKLLLEVIKSAEGQIDVNQQILDQFVDQPSPGDAYVCSPRSSSFGIPEAEDPDPFGVLALERAGLEIRESGSRSRPSSTQFEYHPSPTSPVFARFNRGSIDTIATRSNRGSCISTRTRTSIDRATQTSNMATQTDEPWTPTTSPSDSDFKGIIEEEPSLERHEIDYTKIDIGPLVQLKKTPDLDRSTSISSSLKENANEQTFIRKELKCDDDDDNDNDNDDEGLDNFELEDEDEEPVIFEAASAQATVLQSAKKAGGGLVHIPKRAPPPPVPARSASRGTIDSSTLSALRRQFEKVELCNSKRKSCDDKFLNYTHFIVPNSVTTLPELHEAYDEKT